ncbi:oxidoreductase [Daldinia sp. FL1419]|nr:oxidoreductase [Daldinia sp. FL1419]
MKSLETLSNITLLLLDVTLKEYLLAAVATVPAETNGELDFLVNNAGQQVVMPLLDFDMEQARAMYEVNVSGAAAAVQAFAALLIAVKGTVVNMTSITGFMYPPYMSFYAGTKSALINISEAMRFKLKPLGVKVATVIVGAVRTNILANAPEHRLPPNSLYKGTEKEIAARATGQDVGDRLGTKEDFLRELVRLDYLTVANTGFDRLA